MRPRRMKGPGRINGRNEGKAKHFKFSEGVAGIVVADATKRLYMIKNRKVSLALVEGICGLTIFHYSFLCLIFKSSFILCT